MDKSYFLLFFPFFLDFLAFFFDFTKRGQLLQQRPFFSIFLQHFFLAISILQEIGLSQ
jgi:hypothetical protein